MPDCNHRILLLKPKHLAPDNYQVVPPLGLLYLAAIASRKGHAVRLIDARLGGASEEKIAAEIRRFEPTVCGISALTFEATEMKRLARFVRAVSPTTKIVCGGPHATGAPEDCLNERATDVVVIGEGEETFPELLDAFSGKRPLESVRGIAFFRNGSIMRTEPRPFIEDLDSLPMPAWELVDFEAYARLPSMNGLRSRRYAVVITSRGCPYKCIYCHNIHGKRFRARSPQNVLNEIRRLVSDYLVTEIEFLDDIFNFDVQRTREIFREIADAKLNIKLSFPNGLRADRLDRETVRLMRLAGTHYVYLAIETASERLQKFLGRHLNIEKATQAARWCVEEGIFTAGFFMIGFPSETREEMEATVNLALSLPLHQALFFRVLPLPGAALGATIPLEADMSRQNYFDSTLNVSGEPIEVLNGVIAQAYRRFYLNPRRLLRIFMAYPQRRRLPLLAMIVARRMVKEKSVWLRKTFDRIVGWTG